MAQHIEGFVREEAWLNDLSADEELQRKGREHVQTEAEPRDVDQRVVLPWDQ